MTYVSLVPASNPSGWQLADKLYQFSPSLFIEGTRLLTYGMIVWEGGLFLLIFNRYTRFWADPVGIDVLCFTCVWLKLWFMGFFELGLWAFFFLESLRLRMALWAGPTAGAAQVAEDGPSSILIGAWLPPALLTFGVLLAAFLVRLPSTEKCPTSNRSEDSRNRWLDGHGTSSDSGSPMSSIRRTWLPIAGAIEVRRHGVSFPPQRYLVQIYLVTLLQGVNPLDQGQRDVRSVLSQLLRQMFDDGLRIHWANRRAVLGNRGADGGGPATHRYVPVGMPPVEFFTLTADSGFDGPFRIKYQQDGLDAWCRARGLPIQIYAATAEMLGRFPVQVEVGRIRFWLNHPNLLE